VATQGPLAEAEILEAAPEGVVRARLIDQHAGKWVAIFRPMMRERSRLAAVRAAGALVGTKYPAWRLLAHFLDWLLLDLYLFRRVLRSGKARECSNLVAYAYHPLYTFGRPTWAITPDDIDDHCRKAPTFATVRKLALLEVGE
jgi:Na+-transporting NADH:ubiquinone oxidoreductase subunit NqrB